MYGLKQDSNDELQKDPVKLQPNTFAAYHSPSLEQNSLEGVPRTFIY